MKETLLLGVPIARFSLSQALHAAQVRVDSRLGGTVCFVNVHTLTEGAHDPAFGAVLRTATFRMPDGVPLVWASRWMGEPIAGRVCGPDFMREFSKRNARCGFIGGIEGDGPRIAKALGVEAVSYSPPFRIFSPQNVAEDWKAFLALCPEGEAPSVVWVGLGAPKQEWWIHAASALCPETLFLAVGAAFDFYSGRKTRAPSWMQSLGLEWLYRLAQEPQRLLSRYLRSNLRFLRGIVNQRVQQKARQKG